MIIAIALSFVVCWTPFYVINIVTQYQSTSFLHKSNFLFTSLLTQFIGSLSSAINPIVYHLMSAKFRNSFNAILTSLICCRRCPKSGARNGSWIDDVTSKKRLDVVRMKRLTRNCQKAGRAVRRGEIEALNIEMTSSPGNVCRFPRTSVTEKVDRFVHRLSDATSTKLCDVELDLIQIIRVEGNTERSKESFNDYANTYWTREHRHNCTVGFPVVTVHNQAIPARTNDNSPDSLAIPTTRESVSENDIRANDIIRNENDKKIGLSFSFC